MVDRFTMRIEVWEKDTENDTVFGEFGEVYFRDENQYYAFTEDGFIEIPNPFKNRIDLKRFNHTCRKIYETDLDSGTFLPCEEVLSIDGYPIDGIDIIFKEDGVFPKLTHFYYDDNGHYFKTEEDYFKMIDELK